MPCSPKPRSTSPSAANATLGVSYNGQIAARVQDHGAKGKFVWKF